MHADSSSARTWPLASIQTLVPCAVTETEPSSLLIPTPVSPSIDAAPRLALSVMSPVVAVAVSPAPPSIDSVPVVDVNDMASVAVIVRSRSAAAV